MQHAQSQLTPANAHGAHGACQEHEQDSRTVDSNRHVARCRGPLAPHPPEKSRRQTVPIGTYQIVQNTVTVTTTITTVEEVEEGEDAEQIPDSAQGSKSGAEKWCETRITGG